MNLCWVVETCETPVMGQLSWLKAQKGLWLLGENRASSCHHEQSTIKFVLVYATITLGECEDLTVS